MNISREIIKDAAVGVAVADEPSSLSAIHKDGCAAAIWRRQPQPAFQEWVDNLAPEHLPSGRLILQVDKVRDAVAVLCEMAETPTSEHRERLVDDCAALAGVFAGVTGAPYLRFRLDAVSGDACRRFHVDAMTTRLICTYRGPGTQYGVSRDGDPPTRVFSVPTGAPIVLRGSRYPTGPKTGLLHRSPPIEGTGQTRLVLVLDPLSDAGGDDD